MREEEDMASQSQPVLAETAIGSAAPAAAFTPGPWVACGNDRGGCSCGQVWSRAVDQPVAKANTIWGDDLEHPYGEIPFDEMVANARLIAAAPDLLEALKNLWLRTTVGSDAERVAALTVAGDLLVRLGALEATGGDQ